MGKNFMSDIENAIENESHTPESDDNINNENKILKIGKKKVDKPDIKSFPLRTEISKMQRIDKICKKTGHSKNEIINMFIDYCLENYELEQ